MIPTKGIQIYKGNDLKRQNLKLHLCSWAGNPTSYLQFLLTVLLNVCLLYWQLFIFHLFAMSSFFHYHLYNLFITINNRNKNFSNLNLYLNFRHRILFELILLYQFAGAELKNQANEQLDEWCDSQNHSHRFVQQLTGSLARLAWIFRIRNTYSTST